MDSVALKKNLQDHGDMFVHRCLNLGSGKSCDIGSFLQLGFRTIGHSLPRYTASPNLDRAFPFSWTIPPDKSRVLSLDIPIRCTLRGLDHRISPRKSTPSKSVKWSAKKPNCIPNLWILLNSFSCAVKRMAGGRVDTVPRYACCAYIDENRELDDGHFLL